MLIITMMTHSLTLYGDNKSPEIRVRFPPSHHRTKKRAAQLHRAALFFVRRETAATDSASGPAGRGAEQGIVAACGDPA